MLKWNRRQFLSGLLAAASAGAANSAQVPPALSSLLTAGATPGAAAGASAPVRPRTPAPAGPLAGGSAAPRASVPSGTLEDGVEHDLQALLPEGLRFGRWRVVAVHPVRLGAVPVVLQSRRGERFQVDILRRDRSPRARRGLAETRSYSLFLLNRGQGDTPTREDHGLAVLWLAALLRPREHGALVPLLTQRERTQRFPRGKFNALAMESDPRSAPTLSASAPRPVSLDAVATTPALTSAPIVPPRTPA